jgi:hypothetical protein
MAVSLHRRLEATLLVLRESLKVPAYAEQNQLLSTPVWRARGLSDKYLLLAREYLIGQRYCVAHRTDVGRSGSRGTFCTEGWTLPLLITTVQRELDALGAVDDVTDPAGAWPPTDRDLHTHAHMLLYIYMHTYINKSMCKHTYTLHTYTVGCPVAPWLTGVCM